MTDELEPIRLLPVRSRLYSPEPVGLGTGLVESLASYLVRLAEVHWVRVSDLMACLASETPDDPVPKDHRIFNLMRWRSRELNGMQHVAHRWSALVQDQTCRPRIDQLTLLPWRHLITPRALTHLIQCWCPQCLDEWVGADQPVYWPLLWSLRVVTICPVHRIPLERRCPHCQAAVPALTAYGRIGFCSKCALWLGLAGRRDSADPSVPESVPVTDPAIQIARGALDLLAASTWIPEELSLAKLGELLAYGLQSAHCPQAALADQLKLSRLVLPPLLGGRRHLTIPTLLHVLASLGLEIADFVQKPVTVLVATGYLDDWTRHLPRPQKPVPPAGLKPGQRASAALLADVQAVLETAATQEDPPGLRALARRGGLTTTKVLWSHFPNLCQVIMAKRKSRFNRPVLRQALTESMKAEGPLPSLETIATRLKISPITLRKYCPEEAAALRAQRRPVRDVAALRGCVEAFLKADPPLSLSEISRRLGVKRHHIAQHCPDLQSALVQRFAIYQHARAVERERQAVVAVREAVTQLSASGQLPTKSQVAKLLGKTGRVILTKTESEAFSEMMSELGLWQL